MNELRDPRAVIAAIILLSLVISILASTSLVRALADYAETRSVRIV